MPLPEKTIALIGAVTPFLIIALLAVVLRLHVRVTLLRNPGWDDTLCFLAACCALGTYLSNMAGVGVGFGKPLSDIAPENRVELMKTIWISPPLWGLSSALIKMSIVTSYRRIWTSPRFKLFTTTLVIFLAIFGLTLFLAGILACIPVSLSWAPPTPSSRTSDHCLDIPTFMFATSVLNTFFDILILALPVPLVKRLQIAPRQKAALTAVFTVGLVVVVASVMRLVVIYRLDATTDPSEGGVELGLWSGVELNVAIICSCLPTLRPMLARMFPKLLGGTLRSASSWYGSSAGTRSTRRSRRTTNDGNGSYRMRELPSSDSDGAYMKPAHMIDVDMERGVDAMHQVEVIHSEKKHVSYMNLD
ncbi:uncharacterized protein F4822DRAFT_171479 [Hypoxylon trugodes]|uniref:uncharacterized protein n=1 Tax=Hypoxylon trugodes TaxID=326681 RepID=UPI002193B076|nr:uncharacterized protein F4822DRAFT_171479 [Hypoxylon trugodes]KAI1391069.1 hypothetical protein F4822DRAFT_171479 [Hypoxylon trugodes]